MSVSNEVIVREMKIEDYDEVYDLWVSIKGFGIRAVDDSEEYIDRFIKKNPTTSVVAEFNGKIVGTILCGYDGRSAYFYHVCVANNYRKQRIGQKMVDYILNVLKEEGIGKVHLIAFKSNVAGNSFWHELGWTERVDVNYYECSLNDNNTTNFV